MDKMEDIWTALNKNKDGSINAGDNENTDLYEELMKNCNKNKDDSID